MILSTKLLQMFLSSSKNVSHSAYHAPPDSIIGLGGDTPSPYPRSVKTHAYQATLARCSWLSPVFLCAHVPMPAQPSSSVSDQPLHTNFWHCFPLASAFGQQSSSSVPHYRLSTFGCWAFSVAGPMVWNSCPKICGIRSVLWTTVTDSHWTFLFSQY